MNKLARFDPFAEIDALQKQFFDDDWLTPMRTIHMPTTDVYNNDDKEMVVEAQLPNFSDQDVHVSVDDDYLMIHADKYEKEENGKKKYVVRESSNSLYRRIYLPKRANREAVKATFEDGMLRVTVPYKALPKSKDIVIETHSSKKLKG